MTRLPRITGREIIAALRKAGLEVARIKGSHHFLRHPDGRPLPDVPPLSVVPALPVAALRARHHAEGLALRGRTALPSWQGKRLELGWALAVLHPLATGVGTRTP